jgi:hypothetical protein
MANQDIRNWLLMNPTGPISTIDAPPQKRPRIEQDVEQDVEEDKVNALIYEWRLDRIDPEHPLFDTCYIGQVMRKGLTHEEAFYVRKQEHISEAKREPKDLGLHWAITTFGVEAFSVESLEKERLPRTQAMNWANERETALIDENGGVMRDCEPRVNIQQTFNLTLGGQGDPQKMWLGIQASSRKKLKRVWPKLEAYYEKHMHLRVPISDPDLGSTVHNIRSQKYFLWHADFKAWLDERDFVYDAYAWHVEEEVWPKFKAYYEKHGHLRVPQTDPDLGGIVSNIRSQKIFLWHADFKAWLREHGFKMHARNDRKSAERWAELESMTRINHDTMDLV